MCIHEGGESRSSGYDAGIIRKGPGFNSRKSWGFPLHRSTNSFHQSKLIDSIDCVVIKHQIIKIIISIHLNINIKVYITIKQYFNCLQRGKYTFKYKHKLAWECTGLEESATNPIEQRSNFHSNQDWFLVCFSHNRIIQNVMHDSG